ncbi:hypothetical protein ACFLTC_03300 [Chloroflexota bacterium]
MKARAALLTVVALLLVLGAIPAFAGEGNNLPPGFHYNLNLIGVKDEHPKGDIGCGNGHRIFVDLGKKDTASNTRILLGNSTPLGGGFWVEDCNGTDGEASFYLPEPDPDNDGTTAYSVFARGLGKPGGKAEMVTCGTDLVTGEEICSVHVLEISAHGNNNKFRNVSKYLLYAYVNLCTDWDATLEECNEYTYTRVPLFSPLMEDYLWSYDNYGLKLLQLRFYPGVYTTVPTTGEWPPPS